MAVFIENFTGSQDIEICLSGKDGVANESSTVCITARGGPLYFQFDMRPDEALNMASALVDFANEIQSQVSAAELQSIENNPSVPA